MPPGGPAELIEEAIATLEAFWQDELASIRATLADTREQLATLNDHLTGPATPDIGHSPAEQAQKVAAALRTDS